MHLQGRSSRAVDHRWIECTDGLPVGANWVANWVVCAWSASRPWPRLGDMQHLTSDLVRPIRRTVRLFAWLLVALVALLSARPASAQTTTALPAAWAITPVAGTVNVLVVGCYFAD